MNSSATGARSMSNPVLCSLRENDPNRKAFFKGKPLARIACTNSRAVFRANCCVAIGRKFLKQTFAGLPTFFSREFPISDVVLLGHTEANFGVCKYVCKKVCMVSCVQPSFAQTLSARSANRRALKAIIIYFRSRSSSSDRCSDSLSRVI